MSAIQVAAVGAMAFVALCAASGRLRFLQSEFATIWRRMTAAGLLVAVLAAVVFYPTTGAHLTSTVETDELWFPALFLGHATLILFLLAWWGLHPTAATGALSGTLAHAWSDLRLGTLVGLGGWITTIAVTLTVAVVASLFGVAPTAREDIPPMMTWLAALPLGHKLLVIAAAMTVEEAFFRGFLQTRFGLLLSSFLFMLAHANYGLPFMLISVLTISLLIGRAYQRCGRLLPCVIAHGIFDAIQLLIVLPWAIRALSSTP